MIRVHNGIGSSIVYAWTLCRTPFFYLALISGSLLHVVLFLIILFDDIKDGDTARSFCQIDWKGSSSSAHVAFVILSFSEDLQEKSQVHGEADGAC